MGHTISHTQAARFYSLITQGRLHETTAMGLGETKSIKATYLTGGEIQSHLNLLEQQVTPMNHYVGLNPVKAIPTSMKSGIPYPKRATRRDISEIRNIAIDVDSIREGNRSATNEENQSAINHAAQIISYLESMGIIPVLFANTGNGALIILRADLPIAAEGAVRAFLADIAGRFPGKASSVDTSVFDLPRVIRWVGTPNVKYGPNESDQNIRRSCIITQYDNPTVIRDLSAHTPTACTRTQHAINDRASQQKGKHLLVTMPLADIIKVFEAHGCKIQHAKTVTAKSDDVFDTITTYQSFCFEGCPIHGPGSTSNTQIRLFDGKLTSHCFLDKCKDKSIFDVLAKLGIDPSELSTLYGPGRPSTRMANLVGVFGNAIISNDGERIELKDATIHVKPSGPVLVTPAKGHTTTLEVWATKHCQKLIRAAQSGRWPEYLDQTDCNRLATALAPTLNVVEMQGFYYSFDGTGYTRLLKLDDAIAPGVQAIIDEDRRYLDEQWGLIPKQPSVGVGLIAGVKAHLIPMLPSQLHFGVDLKGKVDLQHYTNYSNGLWLADENRLIQHDPRYFVPVALPITFSTDNAAPRFKKWLAEVLPEPYQRQIALEWLGVISTGNRSHQKILKLFGVRRGGKGTLTDIARALVGEGNHSGTDGATLGYRFGLSETINHRLVTVNEIRELRSPQIELLKQISGNDAVTIPIKHQESFLGKLQSNWVLSSNEIGEFSDSSGVIISRLSVLIFTQSFEGKENLKLFAELKAEMPGIAELARNGYSRFVQQGRFTENTHPNMADYVSTLLDQTSAVAPFISQRCKLEIGAKVEKSQLYAAYCAHTSDASPLTHNKFARELKSLHHSVTIDAGKRYFINIKLIDHV